MDYQISCECGKRITVSAAVAGGEIGCACGRSVAVPRLSELRQLAGQDSYESSIVATITRLHSTGFLPQGDCCVACEAPTTESFDCLVQCERVWKRDPNKIGWVTMIAGFMVFPLSMFKDLLTRNDPGVKYLGRDTYVGTPMRICGTCRADVQRASQRRMRDLVKKTPIYATLFEQFPESKVVLEIPRTER